MAQTSVKFYGVHDMSVGWNLKKAEEIIRNRDKYEDISSVNEVLELYNVKKYFDADIRLKEWDDNTYSDYKVRCQKIPGLLGKFFNTISDANLEAIYSKVEREYIDDFWQIICDFKVIRRISPATIQSVLDNHRGALWHILQQKDLVLQYGQLIAECLEKNNHVAEWLISHFLVAHGNATKPLYFPTEFTQEMRDKALNKYIDDSDPNPSYLKLLEQAQSTKEFPVNDRLKLKAYKKGESLRDKHFSSSAGFPYGVQISFKSIPDGTVEHCEEEHIYCSAYSREWVEENRDYPTILNNFIYLFEYVDRFFRCSFLSLKSELGVFERHLGLKGKKDYEIGMAFNIKSMQSTLQMQAYRFELQRNNIRIEDVFKWFFETYLRDEFSAVGFVYSPPSEGTTYAEKCKLLASSIDGILKQYRLFCEDGYVDRELYEMSSGHMVFGSLPSLRGNKYAYSNSLELQAEQNLLYSDQSMMTYTEKTGSKYETLPQLLLAEEMTMEDFEQYQQKDIQWLIDRGVVSTTGSRLNVDSFRAFLLKDLFRNEVTCPAYYDKELRNRIDKLVQSGDMRYENTFFSKPEQEYLNYILNKSEFSNGLDLRNKYSHDTCSLDEETQIRDYLELLKIMVLIIIKINEEFCLREPCMENGNG